MSVKRTSRDQWRRAAAPICAGVLLIGLGGTVGCQAYPTQKDVPLNCAVEGGYDLLSVNTFEVVGPATADVWNQPDPTVDAGVGNAGLTVDVEAIGGAGRCGSMAALVIRAFHNNDWGSLVGYNNFGPRDESAYEGMSFWARSSGSKTFTISLDDGNTTAPTATVPSNCKDYADGGVAGAGTGTTVDQNGNVISGVVGAAPLPDQCGNSYTYNAVVSADWAFHTVPFGLFKQTNTPNRVPNEALTDAGSVPGTGILTSDLRNLVFRLPKESDMELSLDNLGFYRKKGSAAGADAGVDAAPRE
jgi:hypothetical protein